MFITRCSVRTLARQASLIALMAAASGALSGCETYDRVLRNIDTTKSKIDVQQDKIRADTTDKSVKPIRSSNTKWLGETLVESPLASRLPANLETISLRLPSSASLTQLADEIGKALKVRVTVTDDMAMASAGVIQGGGAAMASLPAPPAVPGWSASMPSPSMSRPSGPSLDIGAYHGSTSQLLNRIADAFDVTWDFSGNELRINTAETKTFRFGLLPTATELTKEVQTGSSMSSSGTTGGNTQGTNSMKVKVSTKLDPWVELKTDLTSLVNAKGGKFAVSPSAGEVTVTAPPSAMKRITTYLNNRKDLTKVVSMSIRLLAIKNTDSDDYGFNLNAALNNTIIGGYKINMVSPTTAVASAVLGGSSSFGAGGLGVQATDATSHLYGNQAVFNALSKAGTTAQARQANLMAMSNQVVSIHDIKEKVYAKEVGIGSSSSSGSSSNFPTITPGTVTYGFNLQVMPRIVDGDHVTVEYSLDLSSLDNLRSIPSGGYTIEAPEKSTFNIPAQQIEVRSGDTLVIAGLEIEDSILNNLGIGTPTNIYTGGSKQASLTKSNLVVIITPTVMDAYNGGYGKTSDR